MQTTWQVVNMAVVAMIKTFVGNIFLPGLGWVTLQWRWCGQATVCSVSKMQILVIRFSRQNLFRRGRGYDV